jgi:hypothetical protein
VVPNKKKIDLELNTDVDIGVDMITFKNIVPDYIPPQGMLGFKKSPSKKIYIEYVKKRGKSVILKNPNKEYIKKSYKCTLEFEGAYVKYPQHGLHQWIFDLDIKSMYPFILISLNISPETKVGRIYDYDYNNFINNEGVFTIEYNGVIYRNISSKSIRKLIGKKNVSLSSNGIFYSLNNVGIVPTILTNWSNKRDIYKKLRDDFGHKGDDESYEFYDRKQHVQKIILNSLYGVLGLSIFRFYDIDNAAATTSTGRTLIKFTEQAGNEYYNNILNNSISKDYVIFIDTDSVAKDSYINTNNLGKIRIDELFNILSYNFNVYTNKEGRKFIFPNQQQSLYYDENKGEVKYGNIQYIEKHRVKKKQYKIKTKNGGSVKVTEDHSLMIMNNNGDLVEKTPKNIKSGDKIVKLL